MSKKKKKSIARRKKFNRNQRLQSGRSWLTNFTGKNIISSYRRWYAVSEVCAIIELQKLGVSIDEETLQKAKLAEKTKESARLAAKKNKQDRLEADLWEDSDENFSFIAGYTSNGVPYGTTWEETDDDFLIPD